MSEDLENDHNEENEDEFPYESVKDYYETCDFISDYWMDLHIRKWGRSILNSEKYKKGVVKNTKLEDEKYIDDDDFLVEPWVSSDARELVRTYFSLRIEAVVKKAFLIAACDKRRTLKKRDIIKSIIAVDIEKTVKDCLCGEIHLTEGEKVKYEE